jgi:hypothetical protein
VVYLLESLQCTIHTKYIPVYSVVLSSMIDLDVHCALYTWSFLRALLTILRSLPIPTEIVPMERACSNNFSVKVWFGYIYRSLRYCTVYSKKNVRHLSAFWLLFVWEKTELYDTVFASTSQTSRGTRTFENIFQICIQIQMVCCRRKVTLIPNHLFEMPNFACAFLVFRIRVHCYCKHFNATNKMRLLLQINA